MSFLATGTVNYPARAERVDLLVQRYPFASQILGFYGNIVQFQKEFYERLPKLWGKGVVAPPEGNLRSELNLPILMKPFGEYLSFVEPRSPGPLGCPLAATANAGRNRRGPRCLANFGERGLLEADSTDPLTEVLARAFLQPYAEFLVGSLLPPVLPMTVCRCPRCNSLPLLGVLRPEGDGGKRFLQCSFCSQEWEFRRILCAHCGEAQEQKLPVYIAEQFPHVRVECCDTCKHFLRTVDLTKDGKAVPIVDDLAAIPLGLWAQENGYTRIQGNLLGT